jgi:hypothetical protein
VKEVKLLTHDMNGMDHDGEEVDGGDEDVSMTY